jgi:TolB-like protein/DNA-binding winged helix-turn-helix (wHTH) protein
VKQLSSSPEVIRFGVFEADARTGELRKHGLRVKLQEQPFQVLCLLLARPGELVTREELRLKLWPADTFVDFEHGLNKAMNKLRDALSDNPERPRYIETLPRRGYRFIAPVMPAQTPPETGESPGASEVPPVAVAASSPRGGRSMTTALIILMGILVLGALAVAYRLARRQASPAAAKLSASPIRSLAVLPLQNLSGDKNEDYFADGMTDELITDLGQMSALRVISNTSVMHYKGTSETLPQIGRELGADAIVEGTVFRSGNRVRITAQLLDARTDRHLWAHGYERDLRDVITMQDEVARDIAEEIRVELTPQERARLAGSHPVNPGAHEAYLKGLYYWNQFTEAGVKKSFGFFQQAIKDDPNYALGYSGLANYYGVMYVRFEAFPRNEACAQEESAALKAVELGGSLAEAHQSLAAARMFCDWDLQGAESEFRRAIQLNPNYAEAHRVYADLLAASGRPAQAVAEAQRAVEDDPMSPDLNMILGWIYYLARDDDRALGQYQRAEAMDPSRPEDHWGLGNVYTQKRQFVLATLEYRKAVELSGGAPWTLSGLGYADALAGKRREAFEVLDRLNAVSKHRLVEPLDRTLIYIGLGDKQQAFAWLEKAYEAREWDMIGLKADPVYDNLRSDARFRDLLRRMNFPD